VQNPTPKFVDDVTDHDESIYRARRQALAAITMAKLDRPNGLEALLRNQPDPTARSFAIELSASCRLPVSWYIQRINDSTDVDIRYAAMLSLGQYDQWSAPFAMRRQLIPRLLEIYRQHPDAALRQATGWLLAEWNQNDSTTAIDEDLPNQAADGRNWYVNCEGQTYVVIPSGDFTMGSPDSEVDHEEDEVQRTYQIRQPIAVATNEVTVADYKRFDPNVYVSSKYSPNDACPMVNVSWFDAAMYCRWLSEQDGVSEDQMCFPPVNEIGPDMLIPTDYASRTGYRLPTEAEWEYACRAGTVTAWSFGQAAESSSGYLRVIANSDNHTWNVRSSKPNAFGLFDMHGNACEWCANPLLDDRMRVNIDDTELRPVSNQPRRTRGGCFGDALSVTRSARRSAQSPVERWATTGFRPVRSMAK
jgi:formylglycine-generating enzyme required for sulfatase activity